MKQVTADPLPSWNDGKAKQSIEAFVQRVTTAGGKDFVPSAERIAVFDNDGTLWPEYPLVGQLAFILDELKRRIPTEPALAADSIVHAALAGDFAKLLEGTHHDGLMRVLGLTLTGMTTEEFRVNVEEWLASARHPKFGHPYYQVIYQPMLELLRYLRANDFKTFIVSGGGADFMRIWVEGVYGIPPEQVVGSTSRATFELRDSGPVLVKTMNYLFVDDKPGMPVGIHQFIGRRPIACFGNSDGEREFAYDAMAPWGSLVDALKEVPQRGWSVVDMKNDWRRIFA